MASTSESPLSITQNYNIQVVHNSQPSGLRFVPAPGFNIEGTVEDLSTFTISGADFGSKNPQRHFDRVDRYWNNGVETQNPYYNLSEGALMPVGDGYPLLGSSWAKHGDGWKVMAEAARPGRTVGYQLESDPDGRMEGFCNGGFAGWPSDQRDSEVVYIRQWRYMLYPPTDKTHDVFDGVGSDAVLKSTLQTGATTLELASIPRIDRFGNSASLEEFYIRLDDGSMHWCQQVEPIVDSTTANFTPPLPSPASAGNPIYVRSNSAHKELRIRDGNEQDGTWNCYAFSGYQNSTSNYNWDRLQDRPYVAWREGVWELWEHLTVAPKLESEAPQGVRMMTRINGRVVLDIKNQTELNGGLITPPRDLNGWPSSGCAITLWGYEEDRPHFIPGNKFRLSDTYVDNSVKRIEIGVGSDDLYSCSNRECCPIENWNVNISGKLNLLPFSEEELSNARIFVVDDNDVPTLVGRITS